MRKRSSTPPTPGVTLPIVEESAGVSKRSVVRGVVQITKSTETVLEKIRPELLSEDVDIERVPVNRPVKRAPKVRQQGDTMIIPVVEEELVVTKRLVLKEEIHVSKRQRIESEEHVVPLRKEKVAIDRKVTEQS